MSITFTVLGIPQTKGSAKGFPIRRKNGTIGVVITNDNTKNKAWASGVRLMAQQHAPVGGPWEGPVELVLTFTLVRPKSLPKRVLHHLKKPDLDKLTRSIKDSLKGVVYYDDSQVVHTDCWKEYESPCRAIGVTVTARHLPAQEGALPL